MSAARNVSAWKVFSVTPNCLRLLEVRRRRRRARPPSRRSPRCRRRPGRRRAPARSSRGPVGAAARPSGAAGVPAKVDPGGAAAVVGRGSRRGSGPRRRRSTRNSPVPPSGSAALTTSTSARAPCGTGSLTPVSVQPSPAAWRSRAAAVAVQRGPARRARTPSTLSPADSAPSSSARCSSVPAAATRPPASTTEVRNGSGASTRPSSSATIADLDRAGAHPAVLLGERQPEDAHLGEPGPQLLVEAGVLGDGPAAVLEVGVRLADQAADGLAQRLLLLVVGEVHVSSPSESRGSCGR